MSVIIVYKATCKVNGKAYVGITIKTEQQRWRQHVACAKASNRRGALQGAIMKHGEDSFVIEQIYVAFDLEEALRAERELIATLGTRWPGGYNLSNGGETSAGLERGPETAEKCRQGRLGKKHTESAKQLMREFHLGRKWSAESRAKASATKKGVPWTEAQRASISAAQQTDDYRAKMRAASAKRGPVIMTDETREKIRAAAVAQFTDPASRAESSERQKRKMADPNRRRELSKTASANWDDPAYREKHAAAMRAVSESPEYIANRRAAMSRRMADPEVRRALSEKAKAQFADPAFRARYEEGLRKAKERRQSKKASEEVRSLVLALPTDYIERGSN